MALCRGWPVQLPRWSVGHCRAGDTSSSVDDAFERAFYARSLATNGSVEEP
jgi:hypothetical protein